MAIRLALSVLDPFKLRGCSGVKDLEVREVLACGSGPAASRNSSIWEVVMQHTQAVQHPQVILP